MRETEAQGGATTWLVADPGSMVDLPEANNEQRASVTVCRSEESTWQIPPHVVPGAATGLCPIPSCTQRPWYLRAQSWACIDEIAGLWVFSLKQGDPFCSVQV